MFRGAGTALNVATVLAGSGLGIALRGRLPERTRSVVTDGLGLVTLLIAALSAAAVRDRHLTAAVGDAAPTLIVLGAVLIGGVVGSLLRLDDRLDGLGRLGPASGGRRAGVGGAGAVRRGLRPRVPGVLRRAADHPRVAVGRARAAASTSSR